jgi:hypothetical protein
MRRLSFNAKTIILVDAATPEMRDPTVGAA